MRRPRFMLHFNNSYMAFSLFANGATLPRKKNGRHVALFTDYKPFSSLPVRLILGDHGISSPFL